MKFADEKSKLIEVSEFWELSELIKMSEFWQASEFIKMFEFWKVSELKMFEFWEVSQLMRLFENAELSKSNKLVEFPESFEKSENGCCSDNVFVPHVAISSSWAVEN